MIHRKLLIATAIVASVVITACSDMTASKNDLGVLPAAAIVAPNSGPATVVATINGGGTAEMQPPGLGEGTTLFGMGVKLYSDGSATGHIDCVDQHGDNFPGNIFGEVTSWRMEGQVVVLNVTGKVVAFPGARAPAGHPRPVSFTVKIQQFGGAGVGHWTLEVGATLFCVELLTSGQIVYRPE
ncbi:MAG TPA: hypothetical protein VGJ80_15405 [Gemmatimonadales bacterium]|jgi:hypothetical protein